MRRQLSQLLSYALLLAALPKCGMFALSVGLLTAAERTVARDTAGLINDRAISVRCCSAAAGSGTAISGSGAAALADGDGSTDGEHASSTTATDPTGSGGADSTAPATGGSGVGVGVGLPAAGGADPDDVASTRTAIAAACEAVQKAFTA